jgi:hypothetical protein
MHDYAKSHACAANPHKLFGRFHYLREIPEHARGKQAAARKHHANHVPLAPKAHIVREFRE